MAAPRSARAPLFVVISGFLIMAAQADQWAIVQSQIDRKFPAVRKIHTTELANWLADQKRAAPLLLDVRTRAEYEVSHLRGARNVEPESDLAKAPLPPNKETPIVTYCSVGYRSAEFAQRLQAAGFTNVRNLEGSIFQWANEGRVLERNGQAVEEVHPYNRIWGTLLEKRRRASVPSVQ